MNESGKMILAAGAQLVCLEFSFSLSLSFLLPASFPIHFTSLLSLYCMPS